MATMLLVDELPVQVFGSVQIYDTPFTGLTENMSVSPIQTSTGPLMKPGVAGVCAVIFTNSEVVVETPQLFLANTVTLPELVPIVTYIILLTDAPVQPLGRVQV